ncbi:mycofactocin system GMC family oxidoreductase MftG [Yinghuangia sp. ASG 101]|uniref:mycofactocin dehydrogenase MftG n=1 Tax=Yinghuangia sp. ASG 101 TaxID=2896848 RepID=UPI001E3573DA|nr:mycofactocin system GMC family oxidoreductase MftG [Yinghuangia sp. ASG 101]UGQ12662.1 mycofactocin system GMC family oxidoreductase MftG [Yinghuangia sp. ASG 101]
MRTLNGVRVPDVLVIGAGASGCALAARLSEADDVLVTLVEAGPVPRDGFPDHALDARLVPGARTAGHPYVVPWPARLFPDRPYAAPRGRVLGGSTTVNGGYFIRARQTDFARWAHDADDERWSYTRVLPFLRASETDLDHPDAPEHGDAGPVPVSRPNPDHPAATAFLAAARESGHAAEPDKNAQRTPGGGGVPTNTRDGHRVNAGLAYLRAAAHRPNLTVRGGCTVHAVVVERGRAVGVLVDDNGRRELLRAGEVVVCAGAFGSAHLLHLSGLGPAGMLAAAGIPVVQDLPEIGAALSDHPQIAFDWTPRRRMPAPEGSWLGAALHLRSSDGDAAGDLEILQSLLPTAALTGGTTAVDPGRPLPFLVSVQTPRRGGGLRTMAADPGTPPLIDYGYLAGAADRRRLREAVRATAAVVGTAAFAEIAAAVTDPIPAVLDDDRALDAWVRVRLGTSQHTCGTVPMGPSGAVDAHGRVYGVSGLRVADTSVLPTAPMRGPAATAVLIGELAADSLLRQ